jgi:hypothetical protein
MGILSSELSLSSAATVSVEAITLVSLPAFTWLKAAWPKNTKSSKEKKRDLFISIVSLLKKNANVCYLYLQILGVCLIMIR